MISNAELLAEIIKSKKQQEVTRRLAEMMIELCDKLGNRSNWNRYTYLEDMKAEAVMALVRGYGNFDETRFSNAHAYLTGIAWNGFLKYLKNEKKAQGIRDDLMMRGGYQPSYGVQVEHELAQSGMVLPPSEGVRTISRRGRRPKAQQASDEKLRQFERALTGEEPADPDAAGG